MPSKDPKKVRAATQRWREKNRVRFNAQARGYRAAKPERHKAAGAKYKKANPEKITAMWRMWCNYPEPTRPEPNACECCGRDSLIVGTLHLDHCHAAHRFRGWLCRPCNMGLGLLGDTVEDVQRMLWYLQR